MDIPANLLPDAYVLGGNAAYCLLIGIAFWTAPWSKIRDSEAQHVYLGAIVTVSSVWLMRAGIQEGLSLHLLLMTALCLMFDWQFALIAASLVVVVATIQGPAGWETFGLNTLLMGALPVLTTRVVLWLVQRKLPHNYFIYVLINAFLVGGICMLLVASASGLLQHAAGVYSAETVLSGFIQISVLLMFGEAFVNGAAITLIVAYRPQWIATFHDNWYLKN